MESKHVIKIIKYSKKYGSYTILLDLEDFEIYQKGSWTYSIDKCKRMRCIHRNNRINNVDGYRILSRLILRCEKNYVVDHINGNSLDNRKINLRIVSSSDNSKNKGVYLKNKIGIKGVHKHKNGSWIAQIQLDSTKIYLGSFKTPEEACETYKYASLFFHGHFSRGLNDN